MAALFNVLDKHTHSKQAKHAFRYKQTNALSNQSYSPSSSSSSVNLTFLSPNPIVLGVCAMDVKTRSKPMREILTRIAERARGHIDIHIFGDKVILDEGITPFCAISHFSHFTLNRNQTWKIGHDVMS
jgi:Diphosphoinositol pentakisphosphate kinase 2 N-terminal domain